MGLKILLAGAVLFSTAFFTQGRLIEGTHLPSLGASNEKVVTEAVQGGQIISALLTNLERDLKTGNAEALMAARALNLTLIFLNNDLSQILYAKKEELDESQIQEIVVDLKRTLEAQALALKLEELLLGSIQRQDKSVSEWRAFLTKQRDRLLKPGYRSGLAMPAIGDLHVNPTALTYNGRIELVREIARRFKNLEYRSRRFKNVESDEPPESPSKIRLSSGAQWQWPEPDRR